ncbi:MAG: sigma-54-dependent Fis family transcriptional regulator [Spirochaetales bacterium]|nr:sigma-54-dependent Fis family transcriptional regulator [Spirochaetales bacterium]
MTPDLGKKIIIIEDEERLLDLIIFNLNDKYNVAGFPSAEFFLESYIPDETLMVITDVRLPGKSGIDVLKAVKLVSKDVPVVIMTAYGSIDQAVSAVKLGAYDYLTKPVAFKQLVELIERVKTYRSSITLEAPLFPEDSGFITCDGITTEQLNLAARVAGQKVPVLILGETGTGKEIVSELVHKASGRTGEFVKINCAAIPSELLEGELFGYRKGAFTGATDSYEGKVKLSDGGTLFLDEIGDLSESLQAKLLRVLEDESFYPLGDNKLTSVDLRVVAATNRDLKAEVDAGRFRSDLYYRLAVVPIRIPPLKERQGDVMLIARSFFEKLVSEGRTRAKYIDTSVYDGLASYSWPGNVRELRNVITQMALLAGSDEIGISRLPSEIMRANIRAEGIPSTYEELKEMKKILKNETVSRIEKQFILSALIRNDWNVSRTSAAVGVDRRYLQNLMKKYNIKKQD